MFHRQPRQSLRLQRCQNRRTGYGYIQGQKVSGESLVKKIEVKFGDIEMGCLEKSWHWRVTRFWTIRGCYILQRCLIQKFFQKWFFQQKMALTVLGKLKLYVFTFADYKLNGTFFLPWQLGNLWWSCRNPLFITFFTKIIPGT